MPNDPLAAGALPDRVFYATGVLLDAEDFRDEQTYHRGRLARALGYLYGSGTVTGLRVEARPASADPDETLVIHPGLAIDRIGRMIEVPTARCIRLRNWFDNQAAEHADDLTQAFKTGAQQLISSAASDGVPALSGFVADVFVRFRDCERGKTPAFATGPFDAVDAAQPSRIRDSAEFELRLRVDALAADQPKLPRNDWPDLAAMADISERRRALQDKLLDSWREGTDARDRSSITPDVEHLTVQDHTAVFIARVILPASSGLPPTRTDGAVIVDNYSRKFVYPAPAAARLFGL
jgi:hypothetical protein